MGRVACASAHGLGSRRRRGCSAGISPYGVSHWTVFVKQNQRKLWRMRLIAKLGEPDKYPERYDRAAADQVRGRRDLNEGDAGDPEGVVYFHGRVARSSRTVTSGRSTSFAELSGEYDENKGGRFAPRIPNSLARRWIKLLNLPS